MSNSMQAGPGGGPRRYLGNIAQLSGILGRVRVRFPGDPAGAIRAAAQELGFGLPAGGGRVMAGHVLDPGTGWRPVEDRPGVGPRGHALAAYRIAALGCLVVAVKAGWEEAENPVALVPVHGLVGLAERQRTLVRLAERLERFGVEEAAGEGRVRWLFRQPPAWLVG